MIAHSEFLRTGDDQIAALGSIETLGGALDKYEIATFAGDDWPRFSELVNLLSPHDKEIMLLYAVLQKRPTDLSILFGKAGHRAEEDLHKAAHKLAGLLAFGSIPSISTIHTVLERHNLQRLGQHDLASCCWEYARCRDFSTMSRLLGHNGLRQQMKRVCTILHASEGREEGLLAGWILWLVDGANPRGKGWIKRQSRGKRFKIGPRVFHTPHVGIDELQQARQAEQRGGRGQRTKNVKIKRHMNFMMRGFCP